MKQKLTHWTDKKFKKKMIAGKGKFKALPMDMKESFKPIGFWLSVDNSWENWLEGNWEGWIKGKICLRAFLDKDINLFIIKTKAQFLKEFKKLSGKDYDQLGVGERFMLQVFHEKLREKYDGMWLLAEPFYKHRLDGRFMYFYPWDCESICVWNKDKIKFKEKNQKEV